VVLGANGIETFRTLRRKALQDLYHDQMSLEQAIDVPERQRIRRGDYFHNGKDVLSVVTYWHSSLRRSSRRSDPFTCKILDVVDSHVLVGDVKKRATIIQLGHLLQEILEQDEDGEICVSENTATVELALPTWRDDFQRILRTGSYNINLD
jgi:hypothetical protein